MPLVAGDKLGPYEILAPIGKGGMGEVYRAHDPRLNRDVAIKVSAERFSERFEREAKAIAALNHPNVCTLYDVGPNYLVMELVEGPTLAERISAGAIPLEESLKVARQIAEALSAAHDKGIVHRDLKPANIKFTPEGKVKVLDFGLAKLSPAVAGPTTENSPTLTMAATQAGVVLGTAAYMSPEQARGKPVDKRADIWAFGVVLYEMVTGKRLFEGDDLTETLASVLKQEPRLDDAPFEVRRLLKKCLQKDPAMRLRDIGDVWELLEEKPLPGGLGSEAEPRPKGAVLWPSVAAAAALALGILAFIHFREKPPAAELVRFEIPAPSGVTLGDNILRLSPDGRKLAFVGTAKDSMPMVWIRSLDSPESRPLPGTEGAIDEGDLAWSPDSRFIAFFSGGKLKKIEAAGGPAQTLCDVAAPQGVIWGLENKIVYGTVGPLFQVSSSGGAPTALTALDRSRQEIMHAPKAFLPDGRHFLYLRLSLPLEDAGTYAGSLDTKPDRQSAQRLLPDVTDIAYAPAAEAAPAPGFLLFVRGLTLTNVNQGATLMAQPFDPEKLELAGDAAPLAAHVSARGFSSSTAGELAYRVSGAQGNRQLTSVDREGKVLVTPGMPGDFTDLALSPDARQVAYGRGNDLALFEFARGVITPFTFGNLAQNPVWSPDGSKIVFISIRSGGWGLYQKASNGAGQEQLLFQLPNPGAYPNLSPDGRFLMWDGLSSDAKNGADLFVLPLAQGAERKPVTFLATEFNESFPRFSSDGRWIAYESDRSGKSEIYVLPFDASNPAAGGQAGLHQVSTGGGGDPHWRGDGKELFFLAPDGTIMAVDVNGSGQAFQSGTPKALLKTSLAPNSQRGWDVTADGKRFLVAAPSAAAATPSSYQVVLNWPQMLKH